MSATDSKVLGSEGIAALLEWYAAAGVDVILDETPRDRFAETAAELGARASGRRATVPIAQDAPPMRADAGFERAQTSFEPSAGSARAEGGGMAPMRVTVPDDVAIADARARALQARTLDELRAALAGFEGCNLRLTAKSLVFGSGPERADLMLIGEAPGRDEDLSGVPFVGKSGQLLDRMLAAIGIARDSVRVTNTVPWRPPGNRPPTPAETEICRPFVARQIELVRPKVVVCLGSPATKAVLDAQDGILRLRGKWLTYSFGLGADETVPAMPMLHPAYLLRQPAQKKLAWRDMLALKEKLQG